MQLPAVAVSQSPEAKFREYLASRPRPQRYTDQQRDMLQLHLQPAPPLRRGTAHRRHEARRLPRQPGHGVPGARAGAGAPSVPAHILHAVILSAFPNLYLWLADCLSLW